MAFRISSDLTATPGKHSENLFQTMISQISLFKPIHLDTSQKIPIKLVKFQESVFEKKASV